MHSIILASRTNHVAEHSEEDLFIPGHSYFSQFPSSYGSGTGEFIEIM